MSQKINDGLTPQQRYHKKNRVSVNLCFMKSTEQDMLDWLEKQPNKAGTIKALIREAMKKENNN